MKNILILLITAIIITALTGTASAGDPTYVGAKRCKMCHAGKYASWKESRMANSFDYLKQGVKAEAKKALGFEDKDYTADPVCLKCHTTGYGKGGFTNIEDTPDLAGVSCEACHGPGSAYKKIMKTGRDALVAAGLVVLTEKECLTCHGGDSPFLKGKSFNFKEGVAKTHDHSTKK